MQTEAITLDRAAFAKALDLAGSVIQRRNTIPALGALKITANGALRMEGTDLDISTAAEIAYDGPALDSFALMEPAKVRAAINAGGGKQIALAHAEKRAQIVSGQLAASIATLPGADHPGADQIADQRFAVDLGGAELNAIARIMPAISTEETRYYLNGVCVHKIGEWLYRFAATDGHRMMIVDVPLPGAEGEIPDGTIIPRGFLQIMLGRFAKAKDTVCLRYGGRQLSNEPDKTLAPGGVGGARVAVAAALGPVRLTIASKLIDGTYPDYQRVIPGTWPHDVLVERSALCRAINALTPLATTKTRAVKITARPDGLRLSLQSVDLGDAHFDVPATHKLPSDFEIGFNGQYLLDCINALRGEEVLLGLTDAGAPTVIRDPADTAFLSVIMPMRV